MNERDAVEALEELGLTGYEAQMFIALHRLGSGSARDVAEVADVPRPQVYSTAELLEQRGLIDVQQSEPIRYRPVAIEEAKATLRNQFENTQETAFEYIEQVRTEDCDDEEREDVWTVAGRETIDARIVHLVGEADREILFGIRSASLMRGDTETALREAASGGVTVTVISRDPSMGDRFEDSEGITVTEPVFEEPEQETGRLLAVDGSTVLLSVSGGEETDDVREISIWSSETKFARVLVRLIRSYLRT